MSVTACGGQERCRLSYRSVSFPAKTTARLPPGLNLQHARLTANRPEVGDGHSQVESFRVFIWW